MSIHPDEPRFRRLLGIAALLPAALPALGATGVEELDLQSLMQIPVMSASKYEQRQEDVAAAVSVITREEIRAFGWRTIDEALASLPGIQPSYDRQYNYLGTRGFGVPGDFNTRLLLTVNGNRVNDAVYDAAISGLAFPVDLDLVERIEYIPGPGGAVYGQNAMFGVVNVVTRTGVGVDAVELAAGYQDEHEARKGRVSWGGLLDNGLDVLLSGTVHKASGEDHFYDFGEAGVSGEARGMDDGEDQEGYARLARGPWSFDALHGDQRKEDPTAQYFSDPLVPAQYQRDRYTLAQLQYQERFADETLQLTGRLFAGRERYTGLFYYSGVPYLATGSSDWQGVESRVVSTAWAGHTLMVGLEAQDNSRRDQTNENRFDPSDKVAIHGSGWRTGVYAQDEWALGDTLRATLGLRLDHDSEADEELSPRAALIWKPADGTLVKALYGRAHRAPNAYERDYDDDVAQVANPELDGETIDTAELVLDQHVGEGLLLRASAYRWVIRDLVVLGIDPLSELSQYRSSDEEVEASGLELSADNTWGWGARLRGSISLQDVTYEGGQRLDNSPRLLGKLAFSSPLGATGLQLGWELQYTGSRRTLDGSDLGEYWLSSVNLRADGWVEGLGVALGIHNLFDEDYADPGSDINWQNAIEQDGRSVRLGVDFSL